MALLPRAVFFSNPFVVGLQEFHGSSISYWTQHRSTLWLTGLNRRKYIRNIPAQLISHERYGENIHSYLFVFCGLRRNEANQGITEKWGIRGQALHHTMEDCTIPIPMNFLYIYQSRHLLRYFSYVSGSSDLQVHSYKVAIFFLFLYFHNPMFQKRCLIYFSAGELLLHSCRLKKKPRGP